MQLQLYYIDYYLLLSLLITLLIRARGGIPTAFGRAPSVLLKIILAPYYVVLYFYFKAHTAQERKNIIVVMEYMFNIWDFYKFGHYYYVYSSDIIQINHIIQLVLKFYSKSFLNGGIISMSSELFGFGDLSMIYARDAGLLPHRYQVRPVVVEDAYAQSHQEMRDVTEPLVGIEPNPGPDEIDLLDDKLRNLSMQNNKNMRKPRNKTLADAISREFSVSKRCAKKKLKNLNIKKNMIPIFESQMFDFPALAVKFDENQYKDILEIGSKLADIVHLFQPSGDGQKPIFGLAKETGETFGAGVTTGAFEMIQQMIPRVLVYLTEKYGPRAYGIFVVIVVSIAYHKSGSRAAFIATCTAMGLYFTYIKRTELSSVFGRVVEYIGRKKENVEEYSDAVQAQMFDITTLTDILVLVLTWTTFPGLKDKHANILRTLGDVGRNYNGIEGAVSFGLRIVQKCLDFISMNMGFKSFSLVETLIPKVDEWVSDARSFVLEFSSGKYVHDQKTYDKVLSLEDRVYELLSLYARDRRNSNIGTLIRPLSNEVSKIRFLLQQEGVCQYKMRQAPLMISFTGVSQIGKSRMMRPFVARLLAMVLPPEDLEKVKGDFDAHVYARQPEHEFWDGYCGQTVCFLDEKDLVKETLLAANNANTDIIRMGNVFPNVLHMAGIEQKGNVHFRSKVVVCTTNVETSAIGAENAVRYPEAVVNRFHFEVAVRVRREYALEEDLVHPQKLWRLDNSKLPGDGQFVPNTHEYVIFKKTKVHSKPYELSLVEDEIVDFETLVRRCADKYKRLEKEASMMPLDDFEAFADGERMRDEHFGAQMNESSHVSFAHLMYNIDNGLPFKHLLSQLQDVEQPVSCARMATLFAKHGHDVPTQEILTEALKNKVPYDQYELLEAVLCEAPLFMKLFVRALIEHETNRMTFNGMFKTITSRLERNLSYAQEYMKTLSGDIHNRLAGVIGPEWNMELLRNVSLLCGKITLLVTSLFGVFKLFKWFTNEKPSEELKFSVAQMSDPALEDIASKIWNNNYYSIHFANDDRHMGYGFFSYGNTFNMCSHYINAWKTRGYGEETLELKSLKGTVITLKVKELFSFHLIGEDWSQGEIPHCRRHADIRPLMADTTSLNGRSKGTIMMIRRTPSGVERNYASYSVSFSATYNDTVGKLYKLPVSLRYDIATREGECGLPLFLVDPTTRSKKFIGFHVAGSRAFGMCYIFPEQEELHGIAQARYVPRTMVEIGEVDRRVGSSGISSIRKSPLFGAWGSAKKSPAHLNSFIGPSGEMIFPMERALMRYDQPILTYDPTLVSTCARAAVVANTTAPAFENLPVRVSIKEAIIGIPGMEFMESLNRGTSPGYPWNMNPRTGFKGKERFFGKAADLRLDGPDWPELLEQVEAAHEVLKEGRRPEFLFSDALKDELLKHEKVRTGHTRLFCPSPIVYQILFGMYFKDFLRKMMESRIQTEHAVGVNVYSNEWDMLARKLMINGKDNVVAGDFKNFDALESAQILRSIGDSVIETFGDREYDDIRRLLWMEVWDSKHVVGKAIFQWKQSLPSGHPATTIVNCLFVSTVMRMCWVRANGMRISSLREFEDNVSLIDYGDDNVLNVSSNASEIFNQHAITEHMAFFGLKYTPEDKEADVPPFRSLEQVEFLKRKFRYEPRVGRYVAPLRLETILEMPYWSKKEGFEDIWRNNLENAIRELALHDEEIFNQWSVEMVNSSRSRTGFVPLIVDRNVLIDEICATGINYKAQICDISPSRKGTLNTNISMDYRELVSSRQKSRRQIIGENTAFNLKSWGIYPYPTKMGCVKQYLGRLRFGTKDRVVFVPQLRLASNTDNNNMVTTLSSQNAMSGTTQILSDMGTKTVERDSLKDIPEGLLSGTRVGYTQSSIYSFLEKPILLSSATWSNQSAGSVLYNSSLPQDAFSQPIYANKIEGFLGFRGTTVIRVQVNGNKFQAGRLLVVFIPQGNVASSWPGMRLRSLTAATQLPRVELDLGSETEVVMEIPYISPTPFYNLNDFNGAIGRAVVMVYSPIATGSGSAEATVSVWCHFKDVELSVPAVAQMADRRPKGKKKAINASEAELTQYGDKPISGGLSHLAKAASSFKQIPLLSNLAGPAAWALNCMAGAASAFGYSKPTTEVATTKVMPMHNFNSQNHNGTDMYPNMGLDASNKLSVMPGYAGTDVDEMALNHLVQIPAYFTTVTMSTSSLPSSLLYEGLVHPHIGDTGAIENLWATRDMTPLGYFSGFFRYWRGSIVITLKFVKTPFHSGRILVCFNPGNISPSFSQSDYLLREIIDIREATEYRFVVPFTSTTQYRDTNGISLTNEDATGFFSIFVLNELVAPSSVASSIKILMEVSAGPDYELALPQPFSAAPIMLTGWASQMADIVPASSSNSDPAKGQGLTVMGSGTVETQSLEPAMYCIGERCNSILQLLKRYCVLNAFGLGNMSNCLDFRPFIYGACYSSDPVFTPIVQTGDYLSLFGPCFAYSRGSVRIASVVNPYEIMATGVNPVVAYPSIDDSAFQQLTVYERQQPGASINWQPSATSTPTGFTLPAYQKLHCRLNRPSIGSTLEPVDIYTSPMRACVLNGYGGNDLTARLFRAVGDDFGLGYFIGVPLLTTSVSF